MKVFSESNLKYFIERIKQLSSTVSSYEFYGSLTGGGTIQFSRAGENVFYGDIRFGDNFYNYVWPTFEVYENGSSIFSQTQSLDGEFWGGIHGIIVSPTRANLSLPVNAYGTGLINVDLNDGTTARVLNNTGTTLSFDGLTYALTVSFPESWERRCLLPYIRIGL